MTTPIITVRGPNSDSKHYAEEGAEKTLCGRVAVALAPYFRYSLADCMRCRRIRAKKLLEANNG